MRRKPPSVPGCALLVLLPLLLAACGRTYYTPEIAGVVASRASAANGATHYVLASGQELTIITNKLNVAGGTTLVYGPVPPDVGDLLLSGTGPNGPWIARLSPAIRSECHGIFAVDGAGTDRGEWIETDAGLRLHKTMGNFDPGDRRTPHEGLRYEGSLPTFCVDANGEVTAFL
jgi:hypothetical protein